MLQIIYVNKYCSHKATSATAARAGKECITDKQSMSAEGVLITEGQLQLQSTAPSQISGRTQDSDLSLWLVLLSNPFSPSL